MLIIGLSMVALAIAIAILNLALWARFEQRGREAGIAEGRERGIREALKEIARATGQADAWQRVNALLERKA